MLFLQFIVVIAVMACEGAMGFSIRLLSSSKPTLLRCTSFHRRLSCEVSRTSFASLSRQPSTRAAHYPSSTFKSSSLLVMRDVSASTSFQLGDVVEVVEDVLKAGTNLRGRRGVVVETWEKCAVDPSCCCAEVDRSMAIRVEFENNTTCNDAVAAAAGTEPTTTMTDASSKSFELNFAEEELWKYQDSK